MSSRWLLLLLLFPLLAGCGGGAPASTSGAPIPVAPSGPDAPPAPPPPPERSDTAPADGGGNTADLQRTLSLHAGWNLVAFSVGQITAVAPGAGVDGLAFAFDPVGLAYTGVELTPEALNSGAGTARGFWIFASQATTLGYDGTGARGEADLLPGWNLIALPGSGVVRDVEGTVAGGSPQDLETLTCGGLPAPSGCAALQNGFAYDGAAGAYLPLDLGSADTAVPEGHGLWVYAHKGLALSRTAIDNELSSEVMETFQSLPHEDFASDMQALAASLEASENFHQVTLNESGTSISASTAEGYAVVISFNALIGSFPAETQQRVFGVEAASGLEPASKGLAPEDEVPFPVLPGSKKVLLVNARPDNRNDGTLDPRVSFFYDRMAGLFQGTGYEVRIVNGSIENLKNEIKDAAVLVFTGHGDVGPYITGTDEHPGLNDLKTIIGAPELRTAELDEIYHEELTTGQMGFMVEPFIHPDAVIPTDYLELSEEVLVREHYFITDEFVRRHWTFAAHSVFLNNCCSGGRPNALSTLANTCFQLGLRTYFGWDNEVDNTDALNTSLFLVDLMVGANRIDPEDARGRSFTPFSCYRHCQRRARPGSIVTYDNSIKVSGFVNSNAHLKWDDGTAGTGPQVLLRPSVEYAYFDTALDPETGQLTTEVVIWGSFPEDVEVVLGDVPLPVKESTQFMVVADVTDENFSADLAVVSQGLVSNKLPVVGGKARFRMEQRFVATTPGLEADITRTATLEVPIRIVNATRALSFLGGSPRSLTLVWTATGTLLHYAVEGVSHSFNVSGVPQTHEWSAHGSPGERSGMFRTVIGVAGETDAHGEVADGLLQHTYITSDPSNSRDDVGPFGIAYSRDAHPGTVVTVDADGRIRLEGTTTDSFPGNPGETWTESLELVSQE